MKMGTGTDAEGFSPCFRVVLRAALWSVLGCMYLAGASTGKNAADPV
jgi:hypothetical protein